MGMYNIILLHAALVQKVLLQVLDGNFYKVVMLLIQSSYSEVQYNCSAILGNLILHCEWSDGLTTSSMHMTPHSRHACTSTSSIPNSSTLQTYLCQCKVARALYVNESCVYSMPVNSVEYGHRLSHVSIYKALVLAPV